MITITIDKTNIAKTHFIDEKDLFLYMLEYMENLEDVKKVKNEIENDIESFDYNSIRGNYV